MTQPLRRLMHITGDLSTTMTNLLLADEELPENFKDESLGIALDFIQAAQRIIEKKKQQLVDEKLKQNDQYGRKDPENTGS